MKYAIFNVKIAVYCPKMHCLSTTTKLKNDVTQVGGGDKYICNTMFKSVSKIAI